MTYVAFHTPVFERLIAAARRPCNVGVLMDLADALGCLGYGVIVPFGAGMLGPTAAFGRVGCAERVAVCDVDERRLALARRFGTDARVLWDDDPDVLRRRCRAAGGDGLDLLLEMSGPSAAVGACCRLADIGAAVVLVGSVVPSPPVAMGPQQVVRRCLRIHGVHNCAPCDLGTAVAFRAGHHRRFRWPNWSNAPSPWTASPQRSPTPTGVGRCVWRSDPVAQRRGQAPRIRVCPDRPPDLRTGVRAIAFPPAATPIAPATPLVWWQARFPSLAHQGFRWFLLGHLVSMSGSWMQFAALAWYVQKLTADIGSEYWLGLNATVSSLPIVLFSPLGGVLADRVARRRQILVTQSAAMALAVTFAAVVWWGWASLPLVFVFSVLNGTVMAFDIPARQAFAVEMVGRDGLLSAIALNSAALNVGRLVGFLLAGVLLAHVGFALCFLLNGLSFLAVIAVLLRITLAAPAAQAVGRGALDMLGGFVTLYRRPRLVGLMAMLGLCLVTGGAYLTLMPALADNVLALGPQGYGWLMAANGAGALAGALVVAAMRSPDARRPGSLTGVVLTGVGLVLLSRAGGLWPAMACMSLVGAGFVLFLACTNSTLQLAVEDAVRGRVMSLWVLTFGASQPVGSYVAGVAAATWGTRATLLGQGLACCALLVLAWLVMYRWMREP